MNIFPTCEFKVWLPGSTLRAGERNEGTLELELPEDVPRAEHVDLVFTSQAIAGYGSGKSRRVVSRVIFTQPLHVTLPEGGLRAGKHSFPFVLDVPRNLPPVYTGSDCSIRHTIDLRLDVDWALDPTAQVSPLIVLPARATRAARAPVTLRSPNDYHPQIALEVQLDSSVIRQGERLSGHIALRTGHAADFQAVVLTLVHVARVRMASDDARECAALELRIPAEALRTGRPFPFRFDGGVLPPTHQNGFLDLASKLKIGLDVSWWTPNRNFYLDLDVVTDATHVQGSSEPAMLLGGSRMTVLARELAARAGLTASEPPTLARGRHGMVELAVIDASHGATFEALQELRFPSLGLNARARPHGILRGATLAPAPLDATCAIKCDGARVPEGALRAFFAAILAGVTTDIELGDHRLAVREPLPEDSADEWLAVTEGAKRRARAVAEAIAALPFPKDSMRGAWTSAASEEGAHLLPHLPALHGVRRAARTSSGEQRELTASIVTTESATRVLVELDQPLPAHAIPELAQPKDELSRAIHARLGELEAHSPTHLFAEVAGELDDPRELLSTLDAVLAWVLRARGERVVDAPYR